MRLLVAAGIDQTTAQIGVPLAVLVVWVLSAIDLRLDRGRRFSIALAVVAVAALAALGAVVVVRVTRLAIGL